MTAPDDIPTEALEAAARALHEHDREVAAQHSDSWKGWDDLTEDERASYDSAVDAALTAAAPHLIAEGRQQAAAEIRASIRTVTSDLLPITEPNRWWAGGMQQAAQIAEGSTND